MAGHPKRNALIAQIEAMPGGWNDVLEAIADGATLRMLGEKFNVSRSFIYRVIVEEPEREKLYQEALRMRADAMIDESIDIADTINPSLPADAQKAKLRIELRKWLAAVDNARYQRAEQRLNVNVNIGQLHLDALRRRAWNPNQLPAPAQEALPAEIVEEKDNG